MLQRADNSFQGELCHTLVETSPLPFKTSRNFSLILNTESFDHHLEDGSVDITLKFPFIGDVAIKKGTTTHIHLTVEEHMDSGVVGLTKSIKKEHNLQDDYLGLFTSQRAGHYLQKTCYALPSRTQVLEHAYPGLCNLLQGTINFQSDGQIEILDKSNLFWLNEMIEEFVSDNFVRFRPDV